MTSFWSRREFIAAVLAGNALAAFAQGKRPGPRRRSGATTQGRPPISAEPLPKPHLWLPTGPGQGAGVRFANSPNWARNTPGWYIPSTVSAGCCMLDFPEITFLSDMIRDFRELPKLLEQARSLGTSTIYLMDWFDGKPGAPPHNYWMFKGDYLPRQDKGGEAALREGISAVHQQGGRVIVYCEGFIINQETNVGMTHGRQWSLIGPKGPPEEPYPGNWKMCPAAPGWLEYVEGLARRIGSYGADGIFFDSQGFQKDWKCLSRQHGHPPDDPAVFNNGCAHLLGRARAALREVNPEGILLIEGPEMMKLFEHVDGSLEWSLRNLVGNWMWDDQGKTDTITASFCLDDWNQIVAIGAKLGLGSQFLQNPPGNSAQDFLASFTEKPLPEKPKDLQHLANHAFWGLHAWRNAGLMLGLPMPGLNDVLPMFLKEGEPGPNPFKQLYSSSERLHGVFEELRPRAAEIDNALRGRQAPGPQEYIKALMTAREKVAPVIDYGSSVELLRSPFPKVVGWRFTNERGMALTAVSVADVPREVQFTNVSGTWIDGVSGDQFAARENTLAVKVPAHGIRLMHVANRES